MVLKSIGLTRENMSTYKQYLYPNGNCLRLRVSNHGIYLQHWFDKNRKARMEGQKIPKLDTACIKEGTVYVDPLQGNLEKVVEWWDTSNLPPKKTTGTTLHQNRDSNS